MQPHHALSQASTSKMLPFLTRTREGHDVLPITYVLLRSTQTIDDGALRPTTLRYKE